MVHLDLSFSGAIFLFVSLHVTVATSRQSRDESLNPYLQCGRAVKDAYRSVALGENAQDRKWCLDTQKKHGTIIGKKFGKMSPATRDTWINSKCEEQIIFKQPLTCNQRLGWYFFENWLRQRYKNKSARTDGIECASSHKTNALCRLSNATVDFSQATAVNGARQFGRGFVTSYGTSNTNVKPAPGYLHRPTSTVQSQDNPALAQCDLWEERPTFVLSNDDPFNLSHYMNDVIMIWSMLVLAGRSGTAVCLCLCVPPLFTRLVFAVLCCMCDREGVSTRQYGWHSPGRACGRNATPPDGARRPRRARSLLCLLRELVRGDQEGRGLHKQEGVLPRALLPILSRLPLVS